MDGGGGVVCLTEKERPMLCPQLPSASSEKWTEKKREGCVCVCVEEGDSADTWTMSMSRYASCNPLTVSATQVQCKKVQ